MQTLKQINYIFDKKQKIQCVGILILVLIGSVFELLGVSAILPLITVVLDPDIIYENEYCRIVADVFHIQNSGEFVILISIGLCIIYIVKNAYLIISRNIQMLFSYNIQKQLSLRLMDFYLHQNYLFHVAHNVAELQRNIGNDVTCFFTTVTMSMNLLVEAATCVLLVAFLFVQDVRTTIIIVGVLLIATLIFLKIYKKLQVKYGKIARNTNSVKIKWLIQAFAGIKEIKVMNREEFFLRNYREALIESNKAGRRSKILSTIPKNIMETICICSLLFAVCLRIVQGVDFSELVTTLSVFALAAIRMLPSFNRITEYLGSVLYNKASVDNVFADLKEAEQQEQVLNLQDKSIERLRLNKEITVRNLTFTYPNTDKKIFDNASITIGKNKSVAFVGSSGAGKTTLADIIIGVLEPQSGEVAVDGVDVFTHLEAWHKTIGYIPQMIYLMDDTICANIVFGLAENEIDEAKVWKALEKAELAEFVRSLPEGINTEIGDRGVRLSGGQRQRIGIARALYREPEVLILDEATSALDNETETAVMQSVENLHGETTLIIIAHRLTTIRNCDEVYEVGNGEIRLKKE